MSPKTERILKTGIVGSIVVAIFSFTPALSALLAYLGLSILVPALDFVMLPLLAVFLALTGYGFWRLSRNA